MPPFRALTGFLPTLTWVRFGVWLGLGLVIYCSHSYHHSRLSKTD